MYYTFKSLETIFTLPMPGLSFSFSAEKPLAQGPPGGVLGILGIVVVFGLIVGVMVTIYTVYKRGQKTRTETDNDL